MTEIKCNILCILGSFNLQNKSRFESCKRENFNCCLEERNQNEEGLNLSRSLSRGVAEGVTRGGAGAGPGS